VITVATNHNLTVEQISTMSTDDMSAYVRSTRNAVKASVKTDRNNTNRAAYATWLAEFKLGILGKDNKGNAQYLIDADWAESFDKTRTITGAWRTAGRVLVDLKVDPDSDVWMRFRNSNIYQTTDGKAVVAKATAETVVADLEAFMDGKVDKFGKRIPKARGAQTDDGTKEAAKKAAEVLDGKIGEFIAEVEKEMTAEKAALLLIASLAKLADTMDHDQWTETNGALDVMVKTQNDRLAALLRKAS
jgi:hypothetical protein